MTQQQIDQRSTLDNDKQLRRHLIAALRLVEARIGVESSLRSEIGKVKQ
jgi:hypothetical protein